jgi:hypothetical protein
MSTFVRYRTSIGRQCTKVSSGKAKGISGRNCTVKEDYHFSVLYTSLCFDFLTVSHDSFTQILYTVKNHKIFKVFDESLHSIEAFYECQRLILMWDLSSENHGLQRN